jgi:hypothetical protein
MKNNSMKKQLIYLLLFLTLTVSGQGIPGILASTGQSSSMLLTGISAAWKFNETTGTNLNDEVGTSDGTSTAAPTASGKIGYGQEFNNTDYISVPLTDLIPAGDKFTVSMWYKMTTLPTDLGRNISLLFYLLPDLPWDAIALQVNTDNRISFNVFNQAGVQSWVESAGYVIVDTWYHIVGVCGGNGIAMKLYLNGVDVSSLADTFTGTGFYAGVTNITIGNNYPDGFESAYGVIDEPRFWDIALTSTQVTELYIKENAGTTYPW